MAQLRDKDGRYLPIGAEHNQALDLIALEARVRASGVDDDTAEVAVSALRKALREQLDEVDRIASEVTAPTKGNDLVALGLNAEDAAEVARIVGGIQGAPAASADDTKGTEKIRRRRPAAPSDDEEIARLSALANGGAAPQEPAA